MHRPVEQGQAARLCAKWPDATSAQGGAKSMAGKGKRHGDAAMPDRPPGEAIAPGVAPSSNLPAKPAERLDKVLARRFPDYSRSRLQTLVAVGAVTVDGIVVTDSARKVPAEATLVLVPPAPVPARPAAEAIPLSIVYEDASLIVLDKPAGMVAHPAAGHASGTLVNALIAHCGASLSGIGGEMRPGIVHRLDKDTSGLLVVAKTDRAHRRLAAQFADHGRTGALKRLYLACAWGVPARRQGAVRAPIGRHPRDRERMAVLPEGRGKHAVTNYIVTETFPGADGRPMASLLECRLETGRTHQIRVHLAHLGHPVLGDPLYGLGFKTKIAKLNRDVIEIVSSLKRQVLHAAVLGFEHPETGEVMEFRSELPADLTFVIGALRGPRQALS
jgi:23S rRNA pseudouridine1911/1915/1917 synthase